MSMEQASQKLAVALIDYAGWIMDEMVHPGQQGSTASVEVKELLEEALLDYAQARAIPDPTKCPLCSKPLQEGDALKWVWRDGQPTPIHAWACWDDR